MVKYFVEFEAFFTQFVKDLSLHQSVDLQIKTKLNEVRLEWDSSEACELKISEFEAKKKEHLCRQQAFDQQILDYQAQIVELNRKNADVEAQKASLETAEELPAQEAVDREVLKGISHGEKALKI